MPLLLPSSVLVALELRGSLEAAKGLTETEAVLATLWTVVWLVLWQPLVSLKSCNCSWRVLGRARSWTLLLVGPFQLRLCCDPWQGFSMKGWVLVSWMISRQKSCWITAQVCTWITLVSQGGFTCVQLLRLSAPCPRAEAGQGWDLALPALAQPGAGSHSTNPGGAALPLSDKSATASVVIYKSGPSQ